LEEAYLAGLDMRHFYQALLKHFRNMLLVKIAADGSSSFDIAPEQIEKLKIQVQTATRETLQRYLEILIAEEDSFRRSQEPRLKLETTIVKMAYLEPIIPIGEIVSTIEAIEQKLCGGIAAGGSNLPPRVSVSRPFVEKPVQTNPDGISRAVEANKQDPVSENKLPVNLVELRDNLKKFIKKENPILGAKIDSAEILSYADGLLNLGFPKGYIFLDDISANGQKKELEKIAQKFFHEEVAVKITAVEVDKSNSNPTNGHNRTNNSNEIKREAMNHPLLQKVMDEFSGAEIIEIKTRTDKK
jgi:DNA polymerase-3 subunit gamma/tau